MSDEDALLAAVAADPAADLPLLVYADWLDDHDDPARAELVRLEVHLVAFPGDDAALVRFRDLSAGCDPFWLARFVRPQVARCGVRFAFACPKKWADMVPTEWVTLRHCDGCHRNVHLCVTRTQAVQAAENGWCVAVDRRLVDPRELPNGIDRITAGLPLQIAPEPLAGDIALDPVETEVYMGRPLSPSLDRPGLLGRVWRLLNRQWP